MFSYLAPRFTCGLCLREQESLKVSQSQSLYRGGEIGIFQVPKPRQKLQTFLSSRAYMDETVRRVTPRQQVVFEGGDQNFLSPRA